MYVAIATNFYDTRHKIRAYIRTKPPLQQKCDKYILACGSQSSLPESTVVSIFYSNAYLRMYISTVCVYIISYNMGTSALPDMYARSPRAEGIHIRQSTSAHVITDMLHFWHS